MTRPTCRFPIAGGLCQRPVAESGVRCYQHQGRDAVVAAAALAGELRDRGRGPARKAKARAATASDITYRPDGTEGYQDLARGIVVVPLLDVGVPVAALRDVIRSKEAAGRAKDLATLPALIEHLRRHQE